MGQTRRREGRPLLAIRSRNQESCHDSDGAVRGDGRVMGTYVHGLFDTPDVTRRWLSQIGLDHLEPAQRHGPAARDQAYDLLADHAEQHLDLDGMLALIPQVQGRGAP